MEDDGGYDAQFVCDVSDDLKCTICHFALKDPVQLADCGHRFCQTCFTKMKDYSVSRYVWHKTW